MKKYFFIIILILILAMVVILSLNFISDSNKKTIKEALTENILGEKEIVENLNETNETIASANTHENIAVNSNEKAKESENQIVEVSKTSKTTKNTIVEKESNTNKNTSGTNNTNKQVTNTTTEEAKDTNKSSNYENNKKESNIVDDTAKKEEKHTHAFTVNKGWFNTEDEAIAKFNQIVQEGDLKYENSAKTKQDWDDYVKDSPTGYEVFRCSCGMFGLNISYR